MATCQPPPKISIWKSAASPAICSLDRHHDLGRNPPILSRFFSRETTHHCALVLATARRAESAVHECWHEPVRADLSRAPEASVEPASRGPQTETHSLRPRS